MNQTTVTESLVRAALGALLAGALLLPLAPAQADPPSWAPAHGWRRKQTRVSTRTTRRPTRRTTTRRVMTRRVVRHNVRGYRHDVDRDGIRNRRDHDVDGDGIRNRRDRDRDGDGVRNRRDDHPRNVRRR